jgi:hypothetical protein
MFLIYVFASSYPFLLNYKKEGYEDAKTTAGKNMPVCFVVSTLLPWHSHTLMFACSFTSFFKQFHSVVFNHMSLETDRVGVAVYEHRVVSI